MAKQTVTAFFDSREYANNAVSLLRQAGVSDASLTLLPKTTGLETGSYADAAGRKDQGFWASLEELFGGSADQHLYAEGLRRGGNMVTARVDEAQLERAIDILERHGSVDLGERETAWRNEGWSEPVAGNSAGPLPSAMALGGGTLSSSRTADPAPATADTVRTGATVDEGVVQVVEEQINVGKRAVRRGKVRLHSYVVETPVSEQVTLRDETVTIDRRPVDRAVSAADLGPDAFRERTIEAEEIGEEAVVAKTARVVEEIGIRKEAADRVETVRDTVRSTRVDIEDDRAARAGTGPGGESALDAAGAVAGSGAQRVGGVDQARGGRSS